MDKLTYFPASERDLDFICQVYAENIDKLHGVCRSEDDWKELLAKVDTAYYIVYAQAPVAWFRIDTESDGLWLGMLQVKPLYQRKGIGRFILSVAEAMAAEKGYQFLGIHTTEDNLAARSLYLSAGYAVTEIGPCQTADGAERVGYTFQKEIAVALRNMTAEEFTVFYQWSTAQQAEDLMNTLHIPRQEAAQRALAEISQLLPDGLHTARNQLMTIVVGGENVGFIWSLYEEGPEGQQCFVCDFALWPAYRRKGYGEAALSLAEKSAAAAGCRKSVLFVSRDNAVALALYNKCGYRKLRQTESGQYMEKPLL